MNSTIPAIAQLTIIKVREPAFMILMLFSALIGYIVSDMESMSFQQDNLVLSSLLATGQGAPIMTGFVIILAMTLLIAVFSGATDIPRDIESRMIMLILGKPVKRTEYLIGKYFGIVGICLAFFTIATVSVIISHLIKAGELYPIALIFRQYLLIFAIFPFVAMTIMFSCFLADLSAMILTAIYVIFSLSVSTIPLLVELLPKNIGIDSYLYIFYYLFPNYLFFLQSFKVFGFVNLFLIIYSIAITVVFMVIASARMNDRDMI